MFSIRILVSLLAISLTISPIAFAQDAPAPHPEPRVIVTVRSLRGPHKKADVERAARLGWGRIVRCYKQLGDGERGTLSVELTVAGSGKVTAARRRHSSFRKKELGNCVARSLRGLAMPKARAGSDARIEIKLGPGDLPAPEPEGRPTPEVEPSPPSDDT